MSLKSKLDEANNSEFSSGSTGGWFKFQEGKNQFRILSEPEILFEDYKQGICYEGCGYEGKPKYLAWILDRADNQVKLMKIPYSIFQNLVAFEEDEETNFTGFPMPYDIKINAKNAGTKEVEYTVMPSIKREAVPMTVVDEVLQKNTTKEIIEKMKQKQIEKHKAAGIYKSPEEREAERVTKFKEGLENDDFEAEASGYEYPENELGEPGF